MIYLDKKDLQKSRKDLNLKEVIIDLICLYLFPNFMKVDQWLFLLEGDRSVGDAKDPVMKVEFYIHVKLVGVVEKWKELSKFREKLNKCKWNAINAKDQVKLQNKFAQSAMAKKYNWSQETYRSK